MMPSSSDEWRFWCRVYFGNIGPSGPVLWLMRRGWTAKNGILKGPEDGRPQSKMAMMCATFLFLEWDYG